MRLSFSCTVAVACLLSPPVAAARTEETSWGKAGVSIDQYRTDAITCGRAGYYADVSGTEAAQVFKDATTRLEANETALPTTAMLAGSAPTPEQRLAGVMAVNTITERSAHIVEGTRPQERMNEVGTLMQAKVEDCLKGRGYSRFKLTSDQRKRLEKLHLGSVERHLYLYQLGTDPDVLKTQAF